MRFPPSLKITKGEKESPSAYCGLGIMLSSVFHIVQDTKESSLRSQSVSIEPDNLILGSRAVTLPLLGRLGLGQQSRSPAIADLFETADDISADARAFTVP